MTGMCMDVWEHVCVCVGVVAAESCHGMYRCSVSTRLSSIVASAAAGLGRAYHRGQEQHASPAPIAAHPRLPDQRAALAKWQWWQWQHHCSRRRCCHIDNPRRRQGASQQQTSVTRRAIETAAWRSEKGKFGSHTHIHTHRHRQTHTREDEEEEAHTYFLYACTLLALPRLAHRHTRSRIGAARRHASPKCASCAIRRLLRQRRQRHRTRPAPPWSQA